MKKILLAIITFTLSSCIQIPGFDVSTNSKLSEDTVASGLKEALIVSTQRTVSELSEEGGFYKDPRVKIPLPNEFNTIKNTLSDVGMGYLVDELQEKVNEAAEKAAPKAGDIFISSVKQITIKDAYDILRGSDNAATQYLNRTAGGKIKAQMKPVIENKLSEVGAQQVYRTVINKYNSLPFVEKKNPDLADFTANKAREGIFKYVAKEEKEIRKNPLKRTTALLRKVFAQQ
jgi:hypothetical protein